MPPAPSLLPTVSFGGDHTHTTMQQPSLSSVLSLSALGPCGFEQNCLNQHEGPNDFSRPFPDMRSCVMGAVNELNDEIDNVLQPICEQAQEHIHADECVLAYGWSAVVEQFLKAAGRKRRFQVIIAEAAPELGGHKLAQNLSNVANISVTLGESVSVGLSYRVVHQTDLMFFYHTL